MSQYPSVVVPLDEDLGDLEGLIGYPFGLQGLPPCDPEVREQWEQEIGGEPPKPS